MLFRPGHAKARFLVAACRQERHGEAAAPQHRTWGVHHEKRLAKMMISIKNNRDYIIWELMFWIPSFDI
jgi:hypothetical protein